MSGGDRVHIYPADPDVGFPFPIMPIDSIEKSRLPIDVLESFGEKIPPPTTPPPPLSPPPRRKVPRNPRVEPNRPSIQLALDYSPRAYLGRHPSTTPQPATTPMPEVGDRPHLRSAFSDWTNGDTLSGASDATPDAHSDNQARSLRRSLFRPRSNYFGVPSSEIPLDTPSSSPSDSAPIAYSSGSLSPPITYSAGSLSPPNTNSGSLSPPAPPRALRQLVTRGTQTELSLIVSDEIYNGSHSNTLSVPNSNASLADVLPAEVLSRDDKIRQWQISTARPVIVPAPHAPPFLGRVAERLKSFEEAGKAIQTLMEMDAEERAKAAHLLV